jgi:hypothetical protein
MTVSGVDRLVGWLGRALYVCAAAGFVMAGRTYLRYRP